MPVPGKKRGVKGSRAARYGAMRFLVLTMAFALIVAVPFATFRWHFDFVQGWYQSLSIGNLWFVSPLEGIESILTSRKLYTPLLIGMLVPVSLALLLGRVFCSWICPISFLTEGAERLRFIGSKTASRGMGLRYGPARLPRMILWGVLVTELMVAMVLGAPIFVFLSPPGLVGRELMMLIGFGMLVPEGLILAVVLLANVFGNRSFCRYFCPLGGMLALLGIGRRLRVVFKSEDCVSCGGCGKSCPQGLDPAKGEAQTAYCWNCGQCVDECKTGALDFAWRR